MQLAEPVAYIVDDDQDTRYLLQNLLQSEGISSVPFYSPQEFLSAYQDDRPGCLILDVRLPGIDGLELQRRLRAKGIGLPVIFLTGYSDVALAVQAMKGGAVDFLTKPFPKQALLETVKSAIARDARSRELALANAQTKARMNTLSQRESQVLDQLLLGKSNKMIAAELGLSHKTVEFHRGRLMAKTQADSLANLVRMTILIRADEEPGIEGLQAGLIA